MQPDTVQTGNKPLECRVILLYALGMMKIKVKLFATLRKYAPQASASEQELEVAQGTTASQVLEQLKIPQAQVAFVFVNSTHQKMGKALADGDKLGVFPPIAGG